MSVENVLNFVKDLGEKEPEVLRGLLEASPEEVHAAAQSRGVDASLDDIKQAGAALRQATQQKLSAENADGELDEEALEAVTGGISQDVLYGAADSVTSVINTVGGAIDTGIGAIRDVGGRISDAGKAIGNIFRGW